MKLSLLALLLFISIGSSARELDSFYFKGTERILFAGENHKNDKSRAIFRMSLTSFKEHGGDTLGLEMIEAQKQYLLDDFLNYKDGSKKALSEYLDIRWQYNTRSYMKLITRARAIGLQIIAIDLDKRMWPKETALFPVPPSNSKVRAAREAHMAEVLCQFNFKKIIILIGSFHAKEEFLPSGLRSECYAESSSFFLENL